MSFVRAASGRASRVAISVVRAGPLGAGAAQWAGGVSVIGQAGERSRESSWEVLAAADPEVLVLGLCGFDLPRTVEEWAAFEVPEPLMRTRAWRTGELWAIDGSAYVSRPGPRLVDGVEVLAAVLAGRDDARAVRLPTSD